MPSWVYEIIQKETNKSIYIGSTTGKYFCLRKGSHTRPSNMKNERQPKLYGFIHSNGGWENYQFVILKQFESIEKKELLTIEKQFIQEKKPECNTSKPIETYEELKERRKLKSRKWRKEHPEYLENMKNSESNKRYVAKRCSTKIECPCGGVYTLQNKSNHFSRQIHKQYENTKTKTEVINNSEITHSEKEV